MADHQNVKIYLIRMNIAHLGVTEAADYEST